MAYKQFTARTSFSSFSSYGNRGTELFLIGGFYERGIPKSFRNISTLVLCEQLPSKLSQKSYGNEYWFVQADIATITKISQMMELHLKSSSQGDHPTICLEGKNRNITNIFSYIKTYE
jgi:hypothetical protein